MTTTESISTVRIAEALMRSKMLMEIPAIQILRDASRDADGQGGLGPKEAKDYIDAAVATIERERIIEERQALATQLLLAATEPTRHDLIGAVDRYRAHVEAHGSVNLSVTHLSPLDTF